MARLESLIAEAVALAGDREFAIFYTPSLPDGPWRVDLVNQYQSVMLGESEGLYCAYGSTPEDAFYSALRRLKEAEHQNAPGAVNGL